MGRKLIFLPRKGYIPHPEISSPIPSFSLRLTTIMETQVEAIEGLKILKRGFLFLL